MTKSLFCIFTIYNTIVIIHIHAEFYLGIWFSFAQKAHGLNMARYVLIDVSFREPIQTNVDCSKISPFVCGNISTYSVAKKYWGLPQILCKPLTHSKIGTYSARWHRLNPMPPCLQYSARQDGCQGRRFHRRSLKLSA